MKMTMAIPAIPFGRLGGFWLRTHPINVAISSLPSEKRRAEAFEQFSALNLNSPDSSAVLLLNQLTKGPNPQMAQLDWAGLEKIFRSIYEKNPHEGTVCRPFIYGAGKIFVPAAESAAFSDVVETSLRINNIDERVFSGILYFGETRGQRISISACLARVFDDGIDPQALRVILFDSVKKSIEDLYFDKFESALELPFGEFGRVEDDKKTFFFYRWEIQKLSSFSFGG